ncbi:MAG: hypothetical protein L3K26_09450 [Candidatus Hydrogenedentes bacterium]|nr:hypothetical protein [Candidatus Hydrogenedentota bacterium]
MNDTRKRFAKYSPARGHGMPCFLTAAVLGVTSLVVSLDASALPAFARKYQTSCMTCHESFPRLNAIGEDFRINGFKFVDDDLYVKEEPVELGDDAYKRLWPTKSVWPSDIPGLPPVSFTMLSRYNMNIGGSQEARSEFVFPNQGKILSAGTFGEDISFFMELGFNQGRGGGHGDEGGGLETELEGWLQFEDLFRMEDKINLRVGTVGMQEFGLFTQRNHNRLTLTPYLYASWAMPTPEDHAVENVFGPGSTVGASDFSIHAQPGVEVNGFGNRWRYALGLVNGNGSVSDNNSEKDQYLQLAYKFGGRGFDGSSGDESGSGLGSGDPWVDDSLTLSLFGYRGTGTVEVLGFKKKDDFWRIGPGFKWKHKDLALGAGYFWGSNDKPYGPLANQSIDSTAWFAEAEYFVLPWLTTTLRYEALDLDLASGIPGLFIQEEQDQSRFVVSTKALIRANLSLTVEGSFYTKDERVTKSLRGGSNGDNSQISVALHTAF